MSGRVLRRRPRVLLDVDGVLADFVGAWLGIVEKETGEKFGREDIDSWEIFDSFEKKGAADIQRIKDACIAATSSPGFCESLAVLEGAQEAVSALQVHADVFIVTSPWDAPYWTYERDKWVSKNFGIHRHNIIHAHAKHVVSGDFLVDDKFTNVASWLTENPDSAGIIWEMPYNRSETLLPGMMRTSHWGDVIQAVLWHTEL